MERREFFKALPALFIAPFQETKEVPTVEERVTNMEVVVYLHGVVLENHKEHIQRLDELHPPMGRMESEGEI